MKLIDINDKNPLSSDIRIVRMGYVDNLPDWSYSWHDHDDDFELVFIANGSGLLHIDVAVEPLESGCLALIPPHTMHYFSPSGPEGNMDYYSLIFHAEGDSWNVFSKDCFYITAPGMHEEFFRGSWKLLLSIEDGSQRFSASTFRAVTDSLTHVTLEIFTNRSLAVRPASGVEHEILCYILQHMGDPLSLEVLARTFHMSASYLSKIFRKAYHISPINYLIYTRITYSTDYLLRTDLSIAEIAEKLGYNNVTHFTNQFRQKIGCSPSEYRARYV